jgi:DNA-directed RNA polymerase subunit RPC12/RpoP
MAYMAWFAYCKDCELRFTLQQQPPHASDEHGREIVLRCPYCGHSDEYTPTDLLRAMEASAVN